MRSIQKLKDITIANTATDSRIILKNEFEDAIDLVVFPTAFTGGGTVTIQITSDDTPSAGGTWTTLQKAGADVALTASKARAISDDNNCVPSCTAMRIHGSAAFTADHTFPAQKTIDES